MCKNKIKRLVAMISLVAVSISMMGCGSSQPAENDTPQQVESTVFSFEVNGVSMAMHEEATAIIPALGDTVNYYETTSCAFEGLDKQYFYEGFQVDTYPTEDKDFISFVIIEGENIPTKEGVQVNDSVDKVKEVYGEDYTDDFGTYVYEKGNSQLKFYFSGDVVETIEYVAVVD